jgi:hypothetical protein
MIRIKWYQKPTCVVVVMALLLSLGIATMPVVGTAGAAAPDAYVAFWGSYSFGQNNVPAGGDFTAIAAGGRHCLALKSDGSLVAWGYNNYGQCNVPAGNDFMYIAAGDYHNLAIRFTFTFSVVAWGWNTFGQCDVPASEDFGAIAAGGYHSLALKFDGSLVAWGNNSDGQCNVPAGSDFTAIAAGGDHSLALKSDGSLVAWGKNHHGQCDVPAGNDFTAIAAGSLFSLALFIGPPALDHIVISPDPATITAGDSQAYTAEAFDVYDNTMGDVTSQTVFSIEAGAGGSWDANVYTSEKAGTWTVTGTYNGKSDTATLTVNPKAPYALTLAANPVNITADGSSTSELTATVEDEYGNPVADGTDVLFETDYGTFASDSITEQTSGGVATATLTSESSTETVIATVTATANGASDVTAVFFIPEGGAEVEESQTETVTDSGAVTDTPTGGDVSIDATGDHTVTIAKYEDNPGGTPTFSATGDYYDVHLDDDTGVTSLTIAFCPAEEDTIVYYWSGTEWVACSDQSYSGGCILVTITDSTQPTLSDLTGLIFGLGMMPMGVSPTAVGGEVYPINKVNVLAPWLSLALILAIGGSILVVRRRRAN